VSWPASIAEARAREPGRWAGLPDVAVEAHLRGFTSADCDPMVLVWALRQRASEHSLRVEVTFT